MFFLLNFHYVTFLNVLPSASRETLENPGHLRVNRGINQGQDLGDGQQVARLLRLRADDRQKAHQEVEVSGRDGSSGALATLA